MTKQLFLVFSILFLLSSCLKEDKLIPGKTQIKSKDLREGYANIGTNYNTQIYYSLTSNQIEASNSRDAWDLAFSCDGQSPNIFGNPAITMSFAPTGSFNFNENFSTSQHSFYYERADRYLTRGVLKQCFDAQNTPSKEVFIINLGTDINNKDRGYKLFQMVSFTNNTYTFNISNLDHSEVQQIVVPQNTSYNNVYISFSKPSEILTLEPPTENWDLLLTKYMEKLYDGSDTLDYSVTGALLNANLTEAYRYYTADTTNFNTLNLDHFISDSLSAQQNIIGHDWKYYNLDEGLYTVDSTLVFFIRDQKGIPYKFHFTGFYTPSFEKGGMSFEYMEL